MASLIFCCPKKWRVIESGIETNDATLYRLREQSITIECPHCRTAHRFNMNDGHLFEMRPRKSSVHFSGLLLDEIDVGKFIARALEARHSSA